MKPTFMKRLVVLLVAVSAAVFGLAAPAQATAIVQFSLIQFNSPGTDTGSNASINAEYARITNRSTQRVYLTGWTIRDAQGYTYTFQSGFSLPGGKSVTVHTGKGVNGTPTYWDRYWQRSYYVWNNTGDTATLRSASSRIYDTCSWGRYDADGRTYC